MGLFTRKPPAFSRASDKSAFVREWVASVLQEAGCAVNGAHADQLADMTSEGVVRQGLKAAAEDNGDDAVVAWLEGLPQTGLLAQLTAIYYQALDMSEARGGPGPALRNRLAAYGRTVDETFESIRSNYVSYARTNFRASRSRGNA
ncbi:MAG TPA: hypothetical protein VGX37_06690 [Allosphingosinicella sp.]|jgi:hypothetical protein|nr:hypothetical protein [Allosphingosinicella sp.]